MLNKNFGVVITLKKSCGIILYTEAGVKWANYFLCSY